MQIHSLIFVLLSKNYTILSPNKAVRFVILKTTYEEDKRKLVSQGLTPKQLRKARKELESKYEDSLHRFDANRNIVTNFSNIQTLTIDC